MPTNPAQAPTVPAHVLPHRTPAQLLAVARIGLSEAAQTRPDGLRYAAAHLAALRAAAALLAAGAGKRAAAEAGIPRVVSAREADDLLRAAEQFVSVVETALGLAHQPALDGLAA